MESDSETGLPASIEAAWGLRRRPSKGPKPGLSLERIVEAAMRVASSDGFTAVSMNRVAKELGSSAMALYRYLSAKDELVSLMLDAVIGDAPPAAADDEGWRAGMSRWCWSYLASLRRHPWALRVPITEPPITPNQVAWLESGLTSLRDTSLTEVEKVSVIMLLSGYVRTTEALFHGIGEALKAADSSTQLLLDSYGSVLKKLIEPRDFPFVSAAIDKGAFDEDDSADDEFRFGLDRILDGVDTLMRARAAG